MEDPRVERHKRHKPLDIIILTICAVISGAEGWEAIEQFGKDKGGWLRQWLELDNGIPLHDCMARVIARLEPAKMTECFIAWVKGVAELTAGEIVAIDTHTGHERQNGAPPLQPQRKAGGDTHGQCLGKASGLVVGSGQNRDEIERDRRDTDVAGSAGAQRVYCGY